MTSPVWYTLKPVQLLASFGISITLALGLARPASAQQTLPPDPVFTSASSGTTLLHWSGGPPGTTHVDSAIFRSAPHGGRLERTTDSPGQNSAFSIKVPVNFEGRIVEVSGWLRTEGVDGWAGLWLRQDGADGTLVLDNMARQRVAGTTEWTRYAIRMSLSRHARSVSIGAHLVGAGKVWVDDLEFLVDGVQPAEAPPAPPWIEDLDSRYDSGSGVHAAALTEVQADNLALLGRVWGFVKYHYSTVTAGSVHWDYALFDVMPAVLDAPDQATALAAIDAWIEQLGGPTECNPCAAAPPDPQLAAELGWIQDPGLLGSRLSSRLVAMHRNRPADAQYFVSLLPGVGNPDFGAELAYADPETPDAGFRLLSLYRFWNIIQYWFPYRDVIGDDWVAVLRAFVPRLMAADDATAYRLAMLELVARVHDTHANLWSHLNVRPPNGTALLPVTLRFIDGKAVVTGIVQGYAASVPGVVPGDVIEALDGLPVDSLVEAWRPLYAASNEPTRLRDMARSLAVGEPGPVRLTLARADSTFEVVAQRGAVEPRALAAAYSHDLPGPAFQRLTPEVAYLKLSSARAADAADYIRKAEGADVLVIDLRNYPSESLIVALGGHLIPEPIPFARVAMPDLANPGAFVWGSTVTLEPIAPMFEGQVVILVDETTQSHAEYTAMAFRVAPSAVVVGSTTAGADGNVSAIPLPGGLSARISGIGIFYPDGAPTQRVGIVPDLVVRPTIQGIRQGRDEVLEAAVSHALGREFRMNADAPRAPRGSAGRADEQSSLEGAAEAVMNADRTPGLESGTYFQGLQARQANAQAYDAAARVRLRAVSVELTGVGGG